MRVIDKPPSLFDRQESLDCATGFQMGQVALLRGRLPASSGTATRGPPCLCVPLRYHRRGRSSRVGVVQAHTPGQTFAVAVGLTSALLHCSSFRYFHSPCRVLCTFRSLYLCNIGCPADRGVTQRDTPTNQATVPGSLTQEDAAEPGGLEGSTTAPTVPMGRSPSLLLWELFHTRVPRRPSQKGRSTPQRGPGSVRPSVHVIKRVGVAHEGNVQPLLPLPSRAEALSSKGRRFRTALIRDRWRRNTFRFSQFSRRY